ncbi:MAG: glycosyltransferase family 39 protein [Acidimicrobiales bacterium]
MPVRDEARAQVAEPAARDRRRLPRHVLIAVAALLVAGTGLRAWALASAAGAFDSDSAVPALMARQILRGDLPVFYWGQPYGGSLESLVSAALFAVLPPWVFIVKLVPMLFCAAAAALTWRIGRRLVGPEAAALAAAVFWVVPFTVWYSTKSGPYWASLACALLSVLLLLRLADAERPPWWEAGALGLALGLAWWSNLSVLLIVPVAVLFLGGRLVRHWKLSWAVAGGFVAGAAPWIAYNLRHDWASLNIGAGQLESTYTGRLRGFFTTALPLAMGLRRTFTHEWLLGPIGPLLYLAALGGFVVFAVRAARGSDRRLWLLGGVVAVYPFVYAASPFTWYVAQPRYVLYLLPFLALLAGRAAAGSPARAAVGVVLIVVIAVVGIARFPTDEPKAAGAVVPVGTSEIHHLLRDHGITHAYSDYWIAYRLTFESRERTIVAPIALWRYQPYQDEVAAAPRPAYIFLSDSPSLPQFLAAATTRSVPVDVFTEGRWTVAVPHAKVLPGDWPEAFGCPVQCAPSWSSWPS